VIAEAWLCELIRSRRRRAGSCRGSLQIRRIRIRRVTGSWPAARRVLPTETAPLRQLAPIEHAPLPVYYGELHCSTPMFGARPYEEATAKRPACTPPTPPPAWSSTDSSHPTAHRRPPRHPHTMARDAPCRNNIRSTKPWPPTGGLSLVGAARRLSRCRAERQITASVGSDGSEQRRRTDHPSHRRCTRTPTNRTCHTDTSSPTNILISGADCARKVLTAICSRDATSSARWNIVAARWTRSSRRPFYRTDTPRTHPAGTAHPLGRGTST